MPAEPCEDAVVACDQPEPTTNDNSTPSTVSNSDPSIDPELSSHTIFRATPSQVLECTRRAYDRWGRGLSHQQWEKIRAHLYGGGEHFAGGKIETWVLAPRNDPTTLDFKCACKTHRRNAVVLVPGTDSNPTGRSTNQQNRESSDHDLGFKLLETTSYGITFVFTKLEYRRRGYCRRMMSLLHWVLSDRAHLPNSEFPNAWGRMPPDCHDDGARIGAPEGGAFSVLYSTVGNFYQFAGPRGGRDGWVMKDIWSTIWDVPPAPTTSTHQSESNSTNILGVRFLTESDLPAIWDRDAEWMKKDILSRAKELASESTQTTFQPLCAILPSHGGASFPHMHSKSYQKYFGMEKESAIWGAVVQEGVTESNSSHEGSSSESCTFSFTTWVTEVPPQLTIAPKRLILTRLRATPATFPLLLGAVFDAARSLGFSEVEAWNVDHLLEDVSGKMGIKTRKEKREKNLGAIKWYLGPCGNATDTGSNEVGWMFNERYAWC